MPLKILTQTNYTSSKIQYKPQDNRTLMNKCLLSGCSTTVNFICQPRKDERLSWPSWLTL